jgi:transcriptional regulator with XRE-family HTH domain
MYTSYKEANRYISRNIKKRRKELKITQAHLAEKINRNKKTIERYENENDKNIPNAKMLSKIYEVFKSAKINVIDESFAEAGTVVGGLYAISKSINNLAEAIKEN